MAALSTTQSLMVFLGRLLFAAVFLVGFWNLVTNWDRSVATVSGHGMPAPEVFLVGALALQLVGGVMVGLGAKAKIGALLLLAFLVPVTFVVHDYWNHSFGGRADQQVHFFKNLALMGGLCLLWVYGAGPFSVDGNKQGKK